LPQKKQTHFGLLIVDRLNIKHSITQHDVVYELAILQKYDYQMSHKLCVTTTNLKIQINLQCV